MTAVVIVVVAVAFVVFWLWLLSQRDGQNPETPPSQDLVSLNISPYYLCAVSQCSAEINYSVQPSRSGATASLRMLTPTNQDILVSDQLRLQRNIPGNDLFWVDGPGQYVFTLVASGLSQGTVTLRDDVYVVGAGGVKILDSVFFTFEPASQYRFIASDATVIGEAINVQGRKLPLDTCEKYFALRAIRYLNGGIAGHPNDLSVTVFNGHGVQMATIILTPGVSGSDTLILPTAIPVADGIVINSSMTSTVGVEFPIGQAIPWDLEYNFDCI